MTRVSAKRNISHTLHGSRRPRDDNGKTRRPEEGLDCRLYIKSSKTQHFHNALSIQIALKNEAALLFPKTKSLIVIFLDELYTEVKKLYKTIYYSVMNIISI